MFAGLIPFIGHAIDDYFVVFRERQNVEKLIKLVEEKLEEKKQAKEEEKRKKRRIVAKKGVKKPWYWPF